MTMIERHPALWTFAIALAIRVGIVALTGFDGLYGQDPFAYLAQARAIAETAPHGDWPRNDFFWPSGYPVVAAAMMWLTGTTLAAAQSVNIVAGAALAPLTYLLARDLGAGVGPRAALAAATLVAIGAQGVQSSVVVMADVTGLWWATLGAWMALRASARPGRAGVAPRLTAGLAIGMATITRWQHALLAPMTVWLAMRVTDTAPLRRLVRWLPAGALALAIVFAQASLTVQTRSEGLVHEWLLSWHPANALARTVTTADGVQSHWLPVGVFYLQAFFHPGLLMPPLGVFACVGAWCLWRQRARLALGVTLGWIALEYAFLAGIPIHNLRFALGYWVPVTILAGVGIDRGLAWGRFRRATAAVALLAMVAMLGWSAWTVRRLAEREAAIRRDVVAMAAHVPPAAPLLSFGVTLTARHVTGRAIREFFDETPATLEALLGDAPVIYLAIDARNVSTQWSGRAPGRNLSWLREHATITDVAHYPGFVLYEVTRHTTVPR